MKRRLFLITMLMGLLVTPVYANRQKTLDATYDGDIEQGTPYIRDDSSGFMQAYYSGDGDRMFIEWNISTIPDTAIIDDVDLRYYHHQGTGDGADIYAMGLQPSVHPDTDQGNTDLYTDAKNGTKYGETTGQSSSWTWYTKDLGVNADAYLEANLTNDWWAVGVESTPDDVYWGTADNSTAPQLIVTYHLPTDPLYVISNPIYENNTDAGTVTVTVSTPTNSTDESISADTNLYTQEEATAFFWDIGGGLTRHIYSPSSENFTVTLPDGTAYSYGFTVKDYTGKSSLGDCYLEAYRTINGVETLIERMKIMQPNPTPINLVYGSTYHIQILYADDTRYDWGYFLAGDDVSNTIITRTTSFTDQAHFIHQTIRVQATRSGGTITVDYNDTRDNTTWANVTITQRDGGTVIEAERSNSTYTLNWASANASYGYIVAVNGVHGDYGEWGYVEIFDPSESFPAAPSLTGIYDFGLGANLGGWVITVSAMLIFSKVLKTRALLVGAAVATLLNYIGFAVWTTNQLIFAWFFSIAVALGTGGGE